MTHLCTRAQAPHLPLPTPSRYLPSQPERTGAPPISFLSKLFGGGSNAAKSSTPAEEHEGYRIYPAPTKESGGYRIGARIEKDIDGETKVHHLIRADQCQSPEEAEKISVLKAKQMIKEQGDGIFR
ncbi:HlyU family transcriptional regulator [Hasllibacter sp. MH4015]|uniref:HlyU family transcriptional regulator n=1 Tax=Hasllibacter sp. MH4015 TaxID=2854029 RepID=UPI002101DC9C|nr:HlyU family transcriptional regulator [Hasllibacter sp. MH4015]